MDNIGGILQVGGSETTDNVGGVLEIGDSVRNHVHMSVADGLKVTRISVSVNVTSPKESGKSLFQWAKEKALHLFRNSK